ncbi:SPOR domain-containing protein [Aestuariibacter sp. AA17]|uniref:SPOR domain-containing protein n=1 Tax=Fluctibacter corallii TaxID=2984329 RepID=A0ABT3AB53_9ALTE|nr:SPOR domain-containing protein [Aestuariibacter sp. AA17]MCV2885900.1 SPOR domain-containing protein [Aestuariibacter sp. AA17]
MNIKTALFLSTGILFVLQGCSAFETPPTEMPASSPMTVNEGSDDAVMSPHAPVQADTLRDEIEMLKAEVNTLKAKQAGIDRLLAIESELKTLIEQLTAYDNQQASYQEASAKQSTPASASSAPTHAPKDEPVANTPVISTRTFTVQLAAMSEQSKLMPTWQQIRRQRASILEGLQPHYHELTRGEGRLFRLSVGQFEQRQQADALCAQLKQQKTACVVGDYATQSLPL